MIEWIDTHAPLIETLLLIVLPLTLLAMITVTAVLFRALKMTSRQLQELHSAANLHAACQVRVSEALHALEQKFVQLTEQNLDIQTQTYMTGAIDEASRLATRGATVATLVESCGLSDGEAELLVEMRRQAQA